MAFQDYIDDLNHIERRIDDVTGIYYEVEYQQQAAHKLFLRAVRTGNLSYNETHHIADRVHSITSKANEKRPDQDHYLGNERFSAQAG